MPLSQPTRYLVTGGSGFIGSWLVKHLINDRHAQVCNVDKQTYAAAAGTLKTIEQHSSYQHIKADIADLPAMHAVFADFQPHAVLNLAAESHVDRSIDSPAEFVQTNTLGVSTLLTAALGYWESLPSDQQRCFRFLQVSSDEVYGELQHVQPFREQDRYAPRSPYAASKAAGDHLARAWGVTYGLPVLVSNAGNNYGPYQFPEKFIPLMVLKRLGGDPLPIYGDGLQVRDWLHVQDHVRALVQIIQQGSPGETYNVGARCERTNLQVAQQICELVDRFQAPDHPTSPPTLKHVPDRPGHDRRYAIDPSKIKAELGWQPEIDFAAGLADTVQWYLDNRWWWEPLVKQQAASIRRGLR